VGLRFALRRASDKNLHLIYLTSERHEEFSISKDFESRMSFIEKFEAFQTMVSSCVRPH